MKKDKQEWNYLSESWSNWPVNLGQKHYVGSARNVLKIKVEWFQTWIIQIIQNSSNNIQINSGLQFIYICV